MGRKRKKKQDQSTPTGNPRSAAARTEARPAPTDLQRRLARIATIGLGLVFVFAGTFKVADPWSFLGSLPAYGIPPFLRLPVTLGMPTIEVVLGIMLLVGWRTRVAAMAAAGVVAAFVAVIGYGWTMGTLQECGCFGPLLKRTPAEALAMDVVFFGMATLGVLWSPGAKIDLKGFRLGVLATAAVLSVAMIGSTLWNDTATLEDRIAAAEPAVSSGVPSLDSLNLRDRDVFLYLFHPDCPHCVRNGPRLASLAEDPALPEIIGITHSVRSGQVRGYLDHAGAEIKAYEFNVASFVQITGDGAVPQLVFLRRGRIDRVWKGDLPGSVELRRHIDATSD